MTAPYELRVALRYLRVHRGGSFLSVITLISLAGVTVGTAALVIALALMTGFEDDVRTRIGRASAHLTVLAATEDLFSGADGLVSALERVEGVAIAGPVVRSPAMILHEEIGASAYAEIYGVEPARHGKLIDLGEWGDGALSVLARPTETGRDAVLLGVDLARALGVAPGDAVRVLVPRVRLTPFAPLPKSRVLEVAGTFRTDTYPQDSQRAYVDIVVARSLLDAEGKSSWVEIRLDDPSRLETMKRAIARALDPGWYVVDLIEQNREILRALNTEKFILFLAIALIVVVAALNIVSTLILMVTDKIKEIGTLTALGARPGGIAAIFMLQGIVIGAVGTALGLACGVAAAVWADRARLIPLNPEVYFMDHVPFAPRPFDVATVGVVTLLVSFLATLYPAWRAARMDPIEAIRHE